MKAYRMNSGYAVLGLNFGTIGVGGQHWKERLYPFNRRLGGLRTRFGRYEKEETILLLLGFELRTVNIVA
jgi:hypothetical protein